MIASGSGTLQLLRERLSMLDRKAAAIWAADCAAHVLPIFTEAQPDDDRPRLAIEAARAWQCARLDAGLDAGKDSDFKKT